MYLILFLGRSKKLIYRGFAQNLFDLFQYIRRKFPDHLRSRDVFIELKHTGSTSDHAANLFTTEQPGNG